MIVDEKISNIIFVYPFSYNGDHFESSCEKVDAAKWMGAKRTFPVWEKQKFPEDDLLPHIANFLNPPTENSASARGWELTNEALQSPRGGLGGGRQSKVLWELITPYGEIPFFLISVQLVLFRIGVGFVNFHAVPKENVEIIDIWLDFIHFFRFSRGRSKVHLQAKQRTGMDPVSKQPQYAPFLPEHIFQVGQNKDNYFLLDHIITALLETTVTVPEPGQKWWYDAFVSGTLLPYSVLFVDSVPEAERYLLRYRVQKIFHSRQKIFPAGEDLLGRRRAIMEYTDNQWFTFSLDGGAYVACDVPDTQFFRQGMPDHLTKQYFFLYLLVLHQRFTLNMLSEKVAGEWLIVLNREEALLEDQEAVFAKIRDLMLTFTALGNFAQVVQRDNPHRYYRRLRETYQIEELYREVSEEIGYMYGYLAKKRNDRLREIQEGQSRQSQRLEKRLNLIAWLIGIVALGLGVLEGSRQAGFPLTAVVIMVSVFIGAIFVWLINRKTK